MEQSVTLEDVARKAGVHRSTVSLALRGSPRISSARRVEIQSIASELGYRANPLIAALMRARRRQKPTGQIPIAFVTNYPTRYGWRPPSHPRPDFFPGAVTRARSLGYQLEHFWLAAPGMTSARFCEVLRSRGIHGMIVGRLPPGQASLSLEWSEFSCLALGLTLREPALHRVTENHFNTVRQAVRRCREYGYRRLGFLFSEEDDSPRVGARWRGAYFSMEMEMSPEDQVAPCPAAPPSFEQFREWIRRERPDALLTSHAQPVLDWLARLRLRVPADIGLVELEADAGLRCAGVDYSAQKIGTLAVEMLDGMMHRNETGVPDDPHEVLINGQWRDGWSLPTKSKSRAF